MTEASRPITSQLLRRWPLPPLDKDGGKEDRGCVLVVGGSLQVPGAAILAATGALRAGAGKLQMATCREVAPLMAIAMPEARVIGLRSTRNGAIAPRACAAIRSEVDGCDALLVGPGVAASSAVSDILRRRTMRGGTLIVDAGALGFLSGRKVLPTKSRGSVILTPHAGEMAKLWAVERRDVLARPLQLSRAAAVHTGAVVVLKGARTYVAAPDGTVFHNDNGNIGLGTSGSGDALSGIIAGLAARGAEPVQAAAWGVYLHAKAGDVLARKHGSLGFLARELPAEVPPLLARLPRTS
jgi:hydroxyethylthiazole kinase-like uncharacterized protein yjeF